MQLHDFSDSVSQCKIQVNTFKMNFTTKVLGFHVDLVLTRCQSEDFFHRHKDTPATATDTAPGTAAANGKRSQKFGMFPTHLLQY